MTYCISDIHGCYRAFCSLMDKIAFGRGDTLCVLGDIIDKGPESVRLAQCIFSMPNAVCIAGNHEYDFLKYYHGLMRTAEGAHGYEDVLRELRAYFPDGALLTWETVDAIERLPYFIEQPDWIGVHAGLPVLADGTMLPPAQASCEQLVYDRRFKERSVLPAGGKCVLFGHTPVRYRTGKDEIEFTPRAQPPQGGAPITKFAKIALDMMTAHSGVLGCLAVETCETFYVGK